MFPQPEAGQRWSPCAVGGLHSTYSQEKTVRAVTCCNCHRLHVPIHSEFMVVMKRLFFQESLNESLRNT